MSSSEHLAHLRTLLHTEKAEDLRQYNQKMRHTSLLEKRQEGICWHPVAYRAQYFGIGGRATVELHRTTDLGASHNFNSGNIVTIFASQEEQMTHQINGVISRITKNEMQVALNTDQVPHWFTDKTLGVFLAFDETTYREMDHALERVQEAKNNRLAELRELFLGNAVPQFRNAEEPLHTDLSDTLNEAQQAALENTLAAHDIALIHGPPGTGKTTTLVAAIRQTLRHEKQVMVCAPSNTAVDVLVEKLTEAGIRVTRLGHPARVEKHLEDHTLDAQFAQSPEHKAYKQLLRKAAQMRRDAKKYRRNFGHRQRQERKAQYAEARDLKEEARHLEDYIIFQILNTAQVVACTLTGAGNKYLRNRFFQTVFLDESAQALEPAVWIPLQRAQRVVMAGDHQQLPPTIKSRKAAREGLEITLFERTIREQPQTAKMLEVQYRMHETIMGFSSQQFYKDRLVAAEANRQHLLFPDEPPLEFWDTTGADMHEVLDEESLSRYNPEEGHFLLRHLENLFQKLLNCPLSGEELLRLEIGVIVPYNAQRRWLQEEISTHEALSGFLHQIRIRTVDGFQGQECDVVYISLVRSNKKGEIGFLSNFRRLNVGLTRAKKKLVVIGDSATLGQHTFFQDFIEYVEQREAYRSVWEWVDVES